MSFKVPKVHFYTYFTKRAFVTLFPFWSFPSIFEWSLFNCLRHVAFSKRNKAKFDLKIPFKFWIGLNDHLVGFDKHFNCDFPVKDPIKDAWLSTVKSWKSHQQVVPTSLLQDLITVSPPFRCLIGFPSGRQSSIALLGLNALYESMIKWCAPAVLRNIWSKGWERAGKGIIVWGHKVP